MFSGGFTDKISVYRVLAGNFLPYMKTGIISRIIDDGIQYVKLFLLEQIESVKVFRIDFLTFVSHISEKKIAHCISNTFI